MTDTEDAEIILSQPGRGPLLGPRVLGEFGNDRNRYVTAKARKNYAATSPITRASVAVPTIDCWVPRPNVPTYEIS